MTVGIDNYTGGLRNEWKYIGRFSGIGDEKMKVENWNGYEIRFVERDGEWWAVLKDVCDALSIKTKYVKQRLRNEVVSTDLISDSIGRIQEMYIINEFGIYDTVFQSRKKESEEFRYWVYEVIKQLRQSTSLEGFQIFKMLDKEHQKEAMAKLKSSLKQPKKVNYIKANTIANKAISIKYDFPKMIKKADMTPDMLKDRQTLLDSTVELMEVKDKYNLDISISEKVYELVKEQQKIVIA